MQFTFGEGPCLDCVVQGFPILVADLAKPSDGRWPAYSLAMLDHHIRGIFAIPIVLAGAYVGALDLFRTRPAELSDEHLAGPSLPAGAAAIPFMSLFPPY